jgi:hypothetical protein
VSWWLVDGVISGGKKSDTVLRFIFRVLNRQREAAGFSSARDKKPFRFGLTSRDDRAWVVLPVVVA